MYSMTLETCILGFLKTSWCLRWCFPGSGEAHGEPTTVEDGDGEIMLTRNALDERKERVPFHRHFLEFGRWGKNGVFAVT